MKVLSIFCLTALPLTLGFSPSSVKARSSTSLSMAASTFPQQPNHGWEGKPITHKGDKTTEPVAAKASSSWLGRQTMEDVMLEPSYALMWNVAALCPLIIWYHPSYAESGPSLIGIAGGLFHLLFAALLWVQTRRVRCVFEKDAFEFYNIKGPHLDLDKGAWLQEKPANYVSGTPNRWRYDKIINYGFFPSLEFPVICYFKETETPVEQWNKWFAAFDSYGLGQPHFFPGIVDVHEFKRQMELRGVKQKPIPTMKTIKKQQQQQKK